jgi:hypothetical protein
VRGNPSFDPTALLEVLVDHHVRFVLIGGFAAVYHGSAQVTFDLDIAPDGSTENLEHLSDALTAMGAKVRTDGGAHRFRHDAASLGRAEMWNLTTPHGDLDLPFRPAGTMGYEDLHRDATAAEVLGIEIEVASLADVIRSKEAADRPKDRIALPLLRRLLEEQGG